MERDCGKEIAPLIELNNEVFGSSDAVQMDKKTFCQKTGLSPEEVEKAMELELLIPQSPDYFDSEDQALGNILSQCFELGLPLEELAYYATFGKKIVKEEMAIHRRLLADEPFENVVTTTLELTRIARTMRSYVIDRLFQKEASRQKPWHQKKGKNVP